MKNSIQIWTVIAFIIFGCDRKQASEHSHNGSETHDHHPGTHQHEDGTIHSDHHHDQHHQEEFKVNLDSISKKDSLHGHSHPDGHTH